MNVNEIQAQINNLNTKIQGLHAANSKDRERQRNWQQYHDHRKCNHALKKNREECERDKAKTRALISSITTDISNRDKTVLRYTTEVAALERAKTEQFINQNEIDTALANQGLTREAVREREVLVGEGQQSAIISTAETSAEIAKMRAEIENKNAGMAQRSKTILKVVGGLVFIGIIGFLIYKKYAK